MNNRLLENKKPRPGRREDHYFQIKQQHPKGNHLHPSAELGEAIKGLQKIIGSKPQLRRNLLFMKLSSTFLKVIALSLTTLKRWFFIAAMVRG